MKIGYRSNRRPLPDPLRRRGAVLLEVVLALVLFVAAAAVIGTGLGTSVESVDRQRLNTHAADLAISVLSELQLGLRSTDPGPEAFAAPFEDWTWELHTAPMESELGEGTGLSLIEVVVRHADPPVVHRLAQVLKPGTPRPAAEGATSATAPDPGGAIAP